ncbi:hypothetical protein D3C77_598050 [compost metagenome]
MRRAITHRSLRLVRQAQQAIGVGQQHTPLVRQHQPTILASEKRGVQRGLQLLQARRHVGLHPVQVRGGPRHAALVSHRFENLQGVEIQVSHFKNLCS